MSASTWRYTTLTVFSQSPVYEVIGDTGISLDLPTVADGWTAGDAYVSVTIDGQHWTPPNAPTAKIALTVPKKGK